MHIPNYMFRSRFRDLGLPLKIGRQLRMLAKICVHVLIRRRLLVMPWSSRRRRYSISGRSRSWPLMIGILYKARGKNMQNCIRLSYASELAAASKWMHTLPIHFHSIKHGKNIYNDFVCTYIISMYVRRGWVKKKYTSPKLGS